MGTIYFLVHHHISLSSICLTAHPKPSMLAHTMPDTEERKQKILAANDPKDHDLIKKAFDKSDELTEEETQKLEQLVAKGNENLSRALAALPK